MPTGADLPTEVYVLILSHVPWYHHNSLRLVCRLWDSIIAGPQSPRGFKRLRYTEEDPCECGLFQYAVDFCGRPYGEFEFCIMPLRAVMFADSADHSTTATTTTKTTREKEEGGDEGWYEVRYTSNSHVLPSMHRYIDEIAHEMAITLGGNCPRCGRDVAASAATAGGMDAYGLRLQRKWDDHHHPPQQQPEKKHGRVVKGCTRRTEPLYCLEEGAAGYVAKVALRVRLTMRSVRWCGEEHLIRLPRNPGGGGRQLEEITLGDVFDAMSDWLRDQPWGPPCDICASR